tara:strand:+ start:137 stop:250 length:114 start_codon:yes stop_codon:yes gene_type:complete
MNIYSFAKSLIEGVMFGIGDGAGVFVFFKLLHVAGIG